MSDNLRLVSVWQMFPMWFRCFLAYTQGERHLCELFELRSGGVNYYIILVDYLKPEIRQCRSVSSAITITFPLLFFFDPDVIWVARSGTQAGRVQTICFT